VSGFDLFPSKPSLLDGFAYLSLFLYLTDALWPKLVHAVTAVACDIERGIIWMLTAKARIHKARECPTETNAEQQPRSIPRAS
jgi:hypothetical protein